LAVPLLLAVELVSGTVRMALALWHSHLTSVGVVETGSHDDVSHSEPVGGGHLKARTFYTMMMILQIVINGGSQGVTLVDNPNFLSPVQKEHSEAVRVPQVKLIEPFLPCQPGDILASVWCLPGSCVGVPLLPFCPIGSLDIPSLPNIRMIILHDQLVIHQLYHVPPGL
jgi:hypothetical protein